MKYTAIIIALVMISCNNKKAEQDHKAVEQLTEENQRLKDEAAQKKATEDSKNKNIIIQQIRGGEGLVITKKCDPIGVGGINNGSFTIENALSGIVFQNVTVLSIVYLANGQVYNSNSYTFTNLKPGDTRTRSIPNTGMKGKTLDVHVSQIQSNWLTNGQNISLE